MPIYEYKCTKCSSRFELKQSYDDEPIAFCPECESRAVRVFHPVPIHFKGSGFYVTDSGGNHSHSTYNNDNQEKSTDDGEKEAVSTSSGSSDTTESKEEKTEKSS